MNGYITDTENNLIIHAPIAGMLQWDSESLVVSQPGQRPRKYNILRKVLIISKELWGWDCMNVWITVEEVC